MNNDEKQAICDILKYIQKHPQAKHTAEGIAQCWILQQRLEEKLQVALVAIRYLVNTGVLEEIQTEDRQYYYRVKMEKFDEFPQIIKKLNC